MNKKTLSNIFKGDKVIWMIFFFLCIISVVEVFSASSGLTYKSGSYMSPLVKHLGILMMGIFCMVITLNIKCKYFKILTPFMLIISFFTLIWVFIAGQSTNGAQRWVSLIGIQFQPSEIAKGTLVLATAQIPVHCKPTMEQTRMRSSLSSLCVPSSCHLSVWKTSPRPLCCVLSSC